LTVTTVARGPSFRLVDTAAEDLIAQRRQAKEEQDSLADAGAPNGDGESAEILADKKSKTYYANGCLPEKEISEANKITFKTAAEAEKAGFNAAKNCH
jgi:hypothetical protein